MKKLIGEWISSIVAIAILGALIDLILPNSNLRKYTGFLFGLIILLMFIQPIIRIWDETLNFETLISRNTMSLNSQTASFHKNFSESEQKKQVEKLFKKSLEKDLAAWLRKNTSLKNVSVDISFSLDRNQIDISAVESVQVWGEWDDHSAFIEPVKIDLTKDGKVNTSINMKAEKEEEIKLIISDIYALDTNKISVNGK